MHFSTLSALAFAGASIAHPLDARTNNPSAPPAPRPDQSPHSGPPNKPVPKVLSVNDQNVLNLANYLENLEFNLYSGGYNNYSDAQYAADGFPQGFRDNVKVIADHERTHIETISQVLTTSGKKPLPPCKYAFPATSPRSFVALANAITSTGIGAYLGGAAPLSDNALLLTAASSILTVEARHDSYLRTGLGGSPFPTSFDTSLEAVFAYNLAQEFIVSCPPESRLPLPIFPKLMLESPPPIPPNPTLKVVAPGTPLKFKFNENEVKGKAGGKQLYIALVNEITNVQYLKAESTGSGEVTVKVPEGAAGAAFAVLTTEEGVSEGQLASQGTLAGPAAVILS